MQYISRYTSPLGEILLSGDELGLTGLWFEGQRYSDLYLAQGREEGNLSAFDQTKGWLDLYFSGTQPDFVPPLHLVGTPFQREVWGLLRDIPYGRTTTYAALARQLAHRRGLARMSAQAVGGAVGHNRISIIVPCHRVVGTSGSLTGYAGGVDRKAALLALEQTDMTSLFVPKKGTAL